MPNIITVAELRNQLSAKKKLEIIDIRSPQDYESGHIDKSENLFFYSPKYKSRISEFAKDSTYVIYCGTECRSREVLDDLSKLGIKDVFILDGGYSAWIGEEVGHSCPL